jgi:hypothetical protein
MDLLIVAVVVFFVAIWVSNVKNKINNFFKTYEVVIVDKEDIERDPKAVRDILSLKPDTYENSMDIRGVPTHLCPCGSNIWNLKVIFDNFEIATYFLDMECVSCGSVATAPTPVDQSEM